MTENDRYLHSKVYKLLNEKGNTFYIGATCLPLHKRLYQHRQNSKKPNHKNIKLYSHFNENTFNDFKIVLVEEFNLQNKEQLFREENRHIEMNKNNPF